MAALAGLAEERLLVRTADLERAAALERLGFGGADALHLACAERAAVDVFLTTDAPCNGWRAATGRRSPSGSAIR